MLSTFSISFPTVTIILDCWSALLLLAMNGISGDVVSEAGVWSGLLGSWRAGVNVCSDNDLAGAKACGV